MIRRHVETERDPGIMPNQLRYIADTAAGNESITVRVIPFNAGVHAGLGGPFTLLEFDGGLSDLLYLDTGRGELATLTANDPDVAEYADKFESLLDFTLRRPVGRAHTQRRPRDLVTLLADYSAAAASISFRSSGQDWAKAGSSGYPSTSSSGTHRSSAVSQVAHPDPIVTGASEASGTTNVV